MPEPVKIKGPGSMVSHVDMTCSRRHGRWLLVASAVVASSCACDPVATPADGGGAHADVGTNPTTDAETDRFTHDHPVSDAASDFAVEAGALDRLRSDLPVVDRGANDHEAPDAVPLPGDLVISELMAANGHTALDHDRYAFSDWIELFNRSDQPVALDGYRLGDDRDQPRWPFPAGTTLAPGAALVVWADGEGSGTHELHASFKLSNEGEEVALFDPSGQLVDLVAYGPQLLDVSLGRDPVDLTWRYFGAPTPGLANDTDGLVRPIRAPAPELSLPPGFYPEPQQLTLTAATSAAEIRYTLDGAVPDRTSPLYTSAIEVNQTTALRARAFEPGLLPSEITTATLFIEAEPALPVVALTAAPEHLWDDEIGIYTTGSNGITGYGVRGNYWQDWERPTNLELFERLDGPYRRTFHQLVGLAIAGERRNLAQKSLAVFARGTYGAGAMDHRFFPDLDIARFKSLFLRNGGFPEFQRSCIRDGVMQRMVADRMDLDQQAFRPALLYINGQFWGLQNLREKLNKDYLAAHHDVPLDGVDLLEKRSTIMEGDGLHDQALLDFLATADLSVPAGFAHVATQIEISPYIDYQIAQIYLANVDWPGNNIKRWRPRLPDGRWRWILFDIEAGLGSWVTADHDTLAFATAPASNHWANPPWSTFVLRKLLESPVFTMELAQRFAAHINTTFAPERLHGFIDDAVAEVEPAMERHIERWAGLCESDGCPVASLGEWQAHLALAHDFIDERPASQWQRLRDFFGLETAELTHTVQGDGTVALNGVVLPATGSGIYFIGLPLRLYARPGPGYRFETWLAGGLPLDLPTVASQTTTFEGDATLTARFERTDETLLPGTILQSTTYDASQSPLVAPGRLVIPEGVEVTLGPGVALLMPEGASIEVRGALRTEGSADAPVRLAPNPVIADRWGALCAPGGRLELAHTRIERAGTDRQLLACSAAVVGLGGAHLHLDEVRLEELEVQPVLVEQSEVDLRHSRLHTTAADTDLINVRRSTQVRIEDNLFTGNGLANVDAVDLDGVTAAVIRGNRFLDVSGFNSDAIDLGEGSTAILIQDNRILGCGDKGISVGQGSNATIVANVVRGCIMGVGVKDLGSEAWIDGNTFFDVAYGVAAYEKNPGAGGGAAAVSNSIIAEVGIAPLLSDAQGELLVRYTLSDSAALPGEGNLVGRPAFAAPGADNFALLMGSAAVDRGDPDAPLDPDGSRRDLGALPLDPRRQLVISEIHYDPAAGGDYEFLEIANIGIAAVDVGGMAFTRGVEVVFAGPLVLPPRQALVVARDATRYAHVDAPVVSWTAGRLANEGETVELVDTAGLVLDRVRYQPKAPWPEQSAGGGPSIEVIDPGSDNRSPDNWRPSLSPGGSPGLVDVPGSTLVAAGHTYGSHGGTNLGLYPTFLEKLEEEQGIDQLVLLGDFVRSSTADAMAQVAAELAALDVETLLVLGNHDNGPAVRAHLTERYGATHYARELPRGRLIVLDVQEPEWGRISPEQLLFVEAELDDAADGDRVFILIHELLWAEGEEAYADLIHNWGSYDGLFESNYWENLHPMLSARPWLEVYVLAGDVGARSDGVAAFYQRLGNVHLIATGMGGHPEENYLRVHLRPERAYLELVALDPEVELGPLPSYGVP